MHAHACALEGRGREWGAKAGERPSREKAAIVKAGQLHEGPRGGGPRRSEVLSSLCVPRGQEEKGEAKVAGAGGKRNKRGERSLEKMGEGRGCWPWMVHADVATHPAKAH